MHTHYVTFMSPGTFVSEETSKEIYAWSTVEAAKMAKDIDERHGARPYGFKFSTRITHDPVPDGEGGMLDVQSKLVKKSGVYYINGSLIRFDDVPEDQSIMRDNMRFNDYPLTVETRNSYRHTGYFSEKDIIVDASGKIIRRGDDSDLLEYRKTKIAEFAEYKKSLRA